MSEPRPPLYDDAGINLADPNDQLGLKSRYITFLQREALRRQLGAVDGVAADIGCGYGRMSRALHGLGFDRVIGIEPSARVLEAAKSMAPEIEFRVGALPDLPLAPGEASTLFLLNVLRALHLLGIRDVAAGCANAVPPGGRLVVLDNLRRNHPDYMTEEQVLALFERGGLRLESRRAVRGARWPWTVLMRFGLVTDALFAVIARFELWWMQWFQQPSGWQYINVIWVFRKT